MMMVLCSMSHYFGLLVMILIGLIAQGSTAGVGCGWLSKRRTWVEGVSPDSDFSIHNIPFGIFSPTNGHDSETHKPRVGTMIGDYVIDMKTIYKAGLFNNIEGLAEDDNIFHSSTLNRFMEHPRPVWRMVRQRLIQLLLAEDDDMAVEAIASVDNDAGSEGTCELDLTTTSWNRLTADHRLRVDKDLCAKVFHHKSDVQLHMPVEVKEYTDFYSSKEHATNVGIMFRGIENALQPNWLHLPVGYHGRASTVVLSGTDVRRPYGQLQKDPTNPKEGSVFAPCKNLDIELEMGVFLGGKANSLGIPITLQEAEERIFGVVLLNDWSARDIQAWEYVPLGPFTSKNFCSSISPWVITLDALEPFRTSPSVGPRQESPKPLEYLEDPDYYRSSFDVQLTVSLQPNGESEDATSIISRSNYRNQYWNMKQQLVHHR